MSLTITHPEPGFTGSHAGLDFVDGVAEYPALEHEARGPLLAHGFTIDGEDGVPETPEEEVARLAQEAEVAQQAAEAAAQRIAEKAEADRLAAEKAAADKAAKAPAKK